MATYPLAPADAADPYHPLHALWQVQSPELAEKLRNLYLHKLQLGIIYELPDVVPEGTNRVYSRLASNAPLAEVASFVRPTTMAAEEKTLRACRFVDRERDGDIVSCGVILRKLGGGGYDVKVLKDLARALMRQHEGALRPVWQVWEMALSTIAREVHHFPGVGAIDLSLAHQLRRPSPDAAAVPAVPLGLVGREKESAIEMMKEGGFVFDAGFRTRLVGLLKMSLQRMKQWEQMAEMEEVKAVNQRSSQSRTWRLVAHWLDLKLVEGFDEEELEEVLLQ